MTQDFLDGKLDEVYMVYNHFYSALTQKPVVVKLLPVEPTDDLLKPTNKRNYILNLKRANFGWTFAALCANDGVSNGIRGGGIGTKCPYVVMTSDG